MCMPVYIKRLLWHISLPPISLQHNCCQCQTVLFIWMWNKSRFLSEEIIFPLFHFCLKFWPKKTILLLAQLNTLIIWLWIIKIIFECDHLSWHTFSLNKNITICVSHLFLSAPHVSKVINNGFRQIFQSPQFNL